MRLSKFLSLSVAMSRNQAKFFIRKGRVSVDSKLITDPNCEIADTCHVTFDGKPICISAYHYFLLNKPAAYICAGKHAEYPSVLELVKDRSEDHHYYFANVLAPELTGLVLLSDDARWTSRMRRKLLKKSCIYHARSTEGFNEDQFQQIKNAWLSSSEIQTGPIVDIQKQDERTVLLKTNQPRVEEIMDIFSPVAQSLERLHLQQMGRLSLGKLIEGDYLELTENEIKV